MRQKIYPDPYGSSTWDPHTYGELSVYLVNSAQYQRFTGLEPPPTPIAAHTYTNAGLPWFDLYDEARGDVAATTRLAAVRSIRSQETEQQGAPHDEPSLNIRDAQIHRLHHDHQPSRPASNNNHDVPDTNR